MSICVENVFSLIGSIQCSYSSLLQREWCHSCRVEFVEWLMPACMDYSSVLTSGVMDVKSCGCCPTASLGNVLAAVS